MNSKKATSALLVMDMQSIILGMFPKHEKVLQNVQTCIAKARKNHIPVIYIVLGFRPGFPEISDSNVGFSSVKQMFSNIEPSEMSKIDPAIAPQAGDIVVTKRRVSAFSGSDLEVVLRAANIKHLVLTGVATSGIVLSTFCEAADKDYQLTVIADACQDRDEEVHKVLTSKIFSRKAAVLNVCDWDIEE